MTASRRDFLRNGAFLAAGLLSGRTSARAQHEQHTSESGSARPETPEPSASQQILPVETPDVPTLLPTMEDGVKVFTLVS